MKKYQIIYADCLEVLPTLEADSVDLIVTDPPYGISFMGKSWDKALPDIEIWRECLRVLKPGAFAFVMSIPRADCLSRMIISLEDAGFNVSFSPIYWTYASGFPKAQNIGKAVDKRLGAEREVIKTIKKKPSASNDCNEGWVRPWAEGKTTMDITAPSTPQAKALDGSYGGFQPKPAVEVIIVAMKPLETRAYVDQALKNGKGVTWLDDCRVPYDTKQEPDTGDMYYLKRGKDYPNQGKSSSKIMGTDTERVGITMAPGRFPANLLVEDDALNDGSVTKSGKDAVRRQEGMFVKHHLGGVGDLQVSHNDSGSFSRYFSLDAWWEERIKSLPASVQKTFPFLIVAKASKSEKNKGLSGQAYSNQDRENGRGELNSQYRPDGSERKPVRHQNFHPTTKPIKLMSYLITLGSREGDVVLDPFVGSGSTALAAVMLNRRAIGIELSPEYVEIARKRLEQTDMRLI